VKVAIVGAGNVGAAALKEINAQLGV